MNIIFESFTSVIYLETAALKRGIQATLREWLFIRSDLKWATDVETA